jgi:hypothetical protein
MTFRLAKRMPWAKAAAAAVDGPADGILNRLIEPEEIIDRFDATYLDDLPHILREVHGVTEENVHRHRLWPELSALWQLGNRPLDGFRIADLPELLVEEAGVDARRYSPKEASQRVKRKYKYTTVASWARTVGLRIGSRSDGGDDSQQELVNTLQREYSLQQDGTVDVEFTDLGRPETGDPWSPLIIGLREDRVVSADEPVLTIGPRWAGEIHYFRQTLGLPKTIGLDLFSYDDELVKVGDMHEMPFADGTFALVYQRNTFDKSYDIRAALNECLRVLRDGGVLISDDCYAYTDGVSELSRTNIKHNRQLLRVLEPHVAKVLRDDEADAADRWIERIGQVAVQVRK